MTRQDVVIVGGGHNGLVAATYLAQAGLSVTVLGRLEHAVGALPVPEWVERWAKDVALPPARGEAPSDWD